MSKHDGAAEGYKASGRIASCLNFIFWINCLVCTSSLLFPNCARNFVSILQIILPILYCLLSFIDDNFFWYPAEKHRRLLWFSDGYNKDFCQETTIGYFNNQYPDSLLRLAVDSFESAFFTKKIAQKMFVESLINGIIVIFVLLTVFLCRWNYTFTLIIAQAIFSGTLLIKFTKQCCFYWRIKNVYDIFFDNFITQGIVNKKQASVILANMFEYECLKSFYQIRLSTRLFEKMNSGLSSEWENMLSKIKLAPSIENNIKNF